MKLKGHKRGYGYYISATVLCKNPNICNLIQFRIDTGCDITTISLVDALFIGLDFSKLSDSSIALGVGGEEIKTFKIYDCGLYFDLGECSLTEMLNQVNIAYPNLTKENMKSISYVPSLLGIDFLQRYTIKYSDKDVYLEK